MGSGRQVTKIKAAGDSATDYTVPTGFFASVNVSVQGVDTAGEGKLLITAPGITGELIVDTNRVAKTDYDPAPIDSFITLGEDLFFSKYKISNDGGVTWQTPREEGGYFILSRQVYSADMMMEIMEYVPSIGLKWLDELTHADRYTIDCTGVAAADVAFRAVMPTTTFVAMTGKGDSLPFANGFNLTVDTGNFNFTTNITSVGGATASIQSFLPWTAAAPILLPGKTVWWSGAAGNCNADVMTMTPIGDTFMKVSWTVGSASPTAPVVLAGLTKIDTVLFPGWGTSSPYVFFFSKENSKYMVTNSAGLFSLPLTTAVSLSNAGAWLSRWDDEEFKYIEEYGGGAYRLYTDKASYIAPSYSGNFTLETEYPSTVTNVVAISPEVLGLSGSLYNETNTVNSTDWLGIANPTQLVTQDTTGAGYITSSLGETLTNTLPLTPVEVPITDTAVQPLSIKGIFLSAGDSLKLVADVATNINITAVEQ